MKLPAAAMLGAAFLVSGCVSDGVPALTENEQPNSPVRFEIGLDRPVTLFSQASHLAGRTEQPELPLFQVCSLAESQAPVDVLLFPNNDGLSEQHPALKKVQIEPGSCVFASGGHIEAQLVEGAYKAADWMNERIRSLKEDERPSQANRFLLLKYENSGITQLQAFLEVTPVKR